MAGTSCIVVGFSFANEAGCKGFYFSLFHVGLNEIYRSGLAPTTLLLILLGLAVLICGGVYEKYTSRECLFPPTMFTDLTTGTIISTCIKIESDLGIVSHCSHHHLPPPSDVHFWDVL